jgi:hypothetical protein
MLVFGSIQNTALAQKKFVKSVACSGFFGIPFTPKRKKGVSKTD